MRLHFPDMHRALPNWRAELTGQGTVRTYKAAISKDPEEKDAWKHEFFETVEALDRDDAARLAAGIFSRLTLSAGGGIGQPRTQLTMRPTGWRTRPTLIDTSSSRFLTATYLMVYSQPR